MNEIEQIEQTHQPTWKELAGLSGGGRDEGKSVENGAEGLTVENGDSKVVEKESYAPTMQTSDCLKLFNSWIDHLNADSPIAQRVNQLVGDESEELDEIMQRDFEGMSMSDRKQYRAFLMIFMGGFFMGQEDGIIWDWGESCGNRENESVDAA